MLCGEYGSREDTVEKEYNNKVWREVDKVYEKRGFKVTLTAEALDVLLRRNLVLDDGEPIRMFVDQERMILTIIYRNDEGPVIAQAGEYPERGL
jgi:hypothetical protein